MKRHNISAALAALLIAAVLCGGCENAPAPAAPVETTAAVTTEAVTPEAPEEPDSPADTGVPDSYTPRSERLECLYYVDTDFHLYDGRSSAYEMNGELLCGVAPHHLTAGHMIAGLYKTAAEHCPDIETVVLIAPMHYDTENTLTTSMKGWNTAFGAVQNDTEITALFRSRLGAAADDYMTEFDHSASSHIPFIKRYLPDAKVSCLLVSPKEHRDIPERLSELLYEISQTKKCFFAFSIDFSHYLDPDAAQQHDKETRSAVLGGDTERIERFTNQNVDT
ncbi:MAG: AmmeMemoRadiSam system protein B, partial [Ruminiclostridium sp.]|nr:AmmeMemoRadiSam system protein B [Ruminiclostridium sp.]